jgi:hypothetical protein
MENPSSKQLMPARGKRIVQNNDKETICVQTLYTKMVGPEE